MRVAILGASNKPERFAYKAFQLLQEYKHTPILVNPLLKTKMPAIEGFPLLAKVTDITEPFHTLTMYVGPAISAGLEAEIIAAKPKRVIFNPGSENPALEKALKVQGIEVVEACTLVMLREKQF